MESWLQIVGSHKETAIFVVLVFDAQRVTDHDTQRSAVPGTTLTFCSINTMLTNCTCDKSILCILITALTSLPSFKRQLKTFLFFYQILPISLIFPLVIFVPCPRSYFSLCHVNLYVLLLQFNLVNTVEHHSACKLMYLCNLVDLLSEYRANGTWYFARQ